MKTSSKPKTINHPDQRIAEINEQMLKLESLRSLLGDAMVNQKRAEAEVQADQHQRRRCVERHDVDRR